MISRGNSRISIALATDVSCVLNRMLLFPNVTHVTVTYQHAELTCCFACEKIARVCDMVRRDERPAKLKKKKNSINEFARVLIILSQLVLGLLLAQIE